MFVYKTQIRLHDTDAAGIIFFANQFKLIHDAYEQLMEKSGWSFQRIFKAGLFFLPVVHAESDFKAPLFTGDKIAVTIKVGHIGNTSFVLEYMLKRSKKLIGTAKTVHVAINPKTRKKIPLPSYLIRILEKYQNER
ncbi:MAG: acyl-CoA thioesterase [Candidatus Omnitrophica bacterium]|nr:acyl-CoA thioesterase [Candidatus Omnitrophota bacterium]